MAHLELDPKDVAVRYGGEVIVSTWSSLNFTGEQLYRIVESIVVVKAGKGQPRLPPGEDTWQLFSMPLLRPLAPGSIDPLEDTLYSIGIVGLGLQVGPRPGLRELNWDNDEKTKRDSNFSTLIRSVYDRCAITGALASPDRVDSLQAAHVCPVSANRDIWDKLAVYICDTNMNMTTEFLESESNGVLLRADVHIAFDAFAVSVLPAQGEWKWTIVAFHPSFQGYAGKAFVIKQPQDAGDCERLVCTLRLHFVYAAQKFAGPPSPV
ncbi:hypothetical protein C8Q78DRAFT_241508 [Trametes maxima]|nr:hypothetical protein C8Q78DRAFT_241508 [Trametes maxima]